MPLLTEPPQTGPHLAVAGLTKRFAAKPALAGIDLALARGECLAVLGPSGCGKSTLLRLVAGFERPDAGTITVGGALLAGLGRFVPPERRGLGIVFQNYALWPHLSVAGNVGYPLAVRRLAAPERARRVAASLAALGLAELAERYPSDLSGGQRQRVALARCLITEPSLILLDEPLAALDVHLRASLEEEFRRLHAASGATLLYVTHDQAEAMALADRIAVMRDGRIEQVAPPATLYREPATAFVADFVGEGGLVRARALAPASPGRATISLGGYVATVRAGAPASGAVTLCLRPDDLRLAIAGEAGMAARVAAVRYRGGHVAVTVLPDGQENAPLQLHLPPGAVPEPGSAVSLALSDGWIVPEATAP